MIESHNSVQPFLTTSLGIALIAFVGPFLRESILVQFSFLGVVIWLVVFVIGLFKLRWRGLWLLVGAPLLLWWPYVAFAMIRACNQNIKNCP